jgi:3-oxoacyl-[acyl-carrier-protein] synthase III
MIGKATGDPISITGLGVYVPERVLTNDELSTIVDTTDEWIMARTGIRERRIAAPEEALTDLALPAARTAVAESTCRSPAAARASSRTRLRTDTST